MIAVAAEFEKGHFPYYIAFYADNPEDEFSTLANKFDGAHWIDKDNVETKVTNSCDIYNFSNIFFFLRQGHNNYQLFFTQIYNHKYNNYMNLQFCSFNDITRKPK